MPAHEKIHYLELPANDLDKIKNFFSKAFGWQFEDYGGDYIAFSKQGVDGGFYRCDKQSRVEQGAALIVLYSADIAATERKIVDAGGVIVTPLYSFPGGRRFHFADPCGNEYAVWTEPAET